MTATDDPAGSSNSFPGSVHDELAKLKGSTMAKRAKRGDETTISTAYMGAASGASHHSLIGGQSNKPSSVSSRKRRAGTSSVGPGADDQIFVLAVLESGKETRSSFHCTSPLWHLSAGLTCVTVALTTVPAGRTVSLLIIRGRSRRRGILSPAFAVAELSGTSVRNLKPVLRGTLTVCLGAGAEAGAASCRAAWLSSACCACNGDAMARTRQARLIVGLNIDGLNIDPSPFHRGRLAASGVSLKRQTTAWCS